MASTLVPFDEQPAPQQAPTTLAPLDQQGMTSADLSGQAVPDKYQAAAIAERDRLLAAGPGLLGRSPLPEGYTRRLMSGPLLGWGDEAAAAMTTPLEMAKRGVGPVEGYRYGKAREDLADKAAEANTGVLGDVAATAGGLAMLPGQIFASPLSAALGGAKQATTLAGKAWPAVARMIGYGTEAGTLGAVQGAGSAETVGDIPREATRAGITSALIGAPFGAAAKIAPQTTALTPTLEELNRSGRFAYKTRDALPVGYSAERAVGDKLTDIADAYGQKHGQQGTPLTTETLQRKAREAYTDVAKANAGNIPPGSVKAPGTYSGAPNASEAVVRPIDISRLRQDIYEQGSGKVSFDAAGRPVRNAIPAGSPADERAATLAAKIVGRTVSHPDPRLLSRGTNMRDAIAASLYDARGRGDFAAAFRSKAVTDAMSDALKGGGNAPFAERLRSSIDKASGSGEYGPRTQAELKNLDRLVRASSWANMASEAGRAMSANSLGGLALAAGAGGTQYAYSRDPMTAAATALATLGGGRALRAIGDKAAIAKAEQYAASLRQRSPLYEQRVMMAPTAPGPGLTVTNPNTGQVFPSVTGAARNALTIGDQGAMRDTLARMLMRSKENWLD